MSEEVEMLCSECGSVFLGPPLQFDEEFLLKVELADKFCSVKCAENHTESQGLAQHAAALR